MMNKEAVILKSIKFAVTFITSFIFAAACYDILLFFGISPFSTFYGRYSYHLMHPLQFIAVPCFVFSVLAVIFSDIFEKSSILKQILLTLLLAFLTVLISSPLGGILWHFHDMLAGHFPQNWLWKLIRYGFREGIQLGWLIIILSIPYNFIGLFVSFFILKTISGIAKNKQIPEEENNDVPDIDMKKIRKPKNNE